MSADDEPPSGWALVLPYDTDNPEFVRGFEAGVLWQQMDSNHHLQVSIHASNAEMVMRMAEAKGFSFRAEPVDEMWMHVELHR